MSGEFIADKYELLRRLGQGGMAEVFLARQRGIEGFEKMVVIKRILPDLIEDKEFTRLFLQEARTAADLRHPNVVTIFDIGSDRGTYYIAMEYLHGQDLRKIQRRCVKLGHPVPLQHALQIVLDVAHGLQYAHTKSDLHGTSMGLIHRDVSPQNIVVTYEGGTKLVDFGIAKAHNTEETLTGFTKGKYTYMSPEQAAGGKEIPVDQRTDQFALGVVMWELLTSRRLFRRENEMASFAAVRDCDVAPPSRVVDVNPRLEKIVMRALERDPNRRYSDMRALLMAVEDFLAEEGLVHSPARLGEWMQDQFADTIDKERRGDMASAQAEVEFAEVPTRGGRRNSDPSAETPTRVSHVNGKPKVKEKHPTTNSLPSYSLDRIEEKYDRTHRIRTHIHGVDHVAEGLAQKPNYGLLVGLVAVIVVVLLGVAGLVGWSQRVGMGTVLVRTTPPQAVIFRDGATSGSKTPAVLQDIPVDQEVAIEVRLDGYRAETFYVRIAKEGQEMRVETKLEKLGTADNPDETPGRKE